MIHELKIATEYFEAVISGEKTFEIRKHDRLFHKGDLLALNEYEGNLYSGRSCLVYIDYILTDSDYVMKDYVTMSIKPCIVEKITKPINHCSLKPDYRVPLVTERWESDTE